jgi:indolepyruvate ferredoxin oxidoreductase
VRPSTAEPYGILVTGIGGTGVVTIGALLGMAAHLEGKGASVLDMTGLAQKNGAVVSHVRIADTPEQLHATRIAAGEANLVLACDILTGVGDEALAKMQKGVTRALVNTALVMPAQFTRDPDLRFPTGSMEQEIRDAVAPGDAEFLDGTKIATGLMGDSIATNLFMVGYAYQRGLLPIGEAAILRAIELNGAAVESNKQSFLWGRLAAVEPDLVIVHGSHDVHQDHHMVHRAVLAALRRTSCDLLAFATRLPTGAAPPPPTCVVDISSSIDRKLAAISEHASQFPPTFAEARRDVARTLGHSHGVPYAEVFEVLRITL